MSCAGKYEFSFSGFSPSGAPKGAPPPSSEGGKRNGKQAVERKRKGWRINWFISIGEFEKPPSPPRSGRLGGLGIVQGNL